MNDITIRYLNEEDFNNGYFQTLSNLTYVGDIQNDNEKFKSIFKSINFKNQHIFVAIDDIKIVGTASILIEQKFIHNGSKVGHIEDVVVHQDYQTMGIGSKLIRKCIEVGKSNDCYKIILDCNSIKMGFYEKHGF
jgi:glucosamine-phosphate N-acetyltransferase